MDWLDKEQVKEYHQKWRNENRESVRKSVRMWRENNPERSQELDRIYKKRRKEKIREYARKRRETCNFAIKEIQKKHLRKNPWMLSYHGARQRCCNLRNQAYKYYGDRGIQFNLTKEEIKILWLRDGASKMKKPTIDRKNNDGHYEFDNCQFLELVENAKKQAKQRREKCKKILLKQS